MDEAEGDSRYPSNYGANQGYSLTQRPHSQPISSDYVDLDDDEVEEDEEQEADANDNENEINGKIQQNGDNEDTDDSDDDHDGEDDQKNENFNLHRHPKKRKLKSLLSSFELVPRVPTPAPLRIQQPGSRPSFGGRNSFTDWSEIETFALLESWGERFVNRGRKSLRSEEWQEVADKVAQVSRIVRTDTQCRNRLDTLKKKYKKEKAMLEHDKSATTKWVYFKKMDMLLSATPQPHPQLQLQPKLEPQPQLQLQPKLEHQHQPQNRQVSVYQNRAGADGLDEMVNSPVDTDSDEDDDSDLLPPKKSKNREKKANVSSFKLLADSINKFSDIYEKIETRKRKEMVELENMRMEFYRDLELQKKQILDKAKDEIMKIRRGDYEGNGSAGNVSG